MKYNKRVDPVNRLKKRIIWGCVITSLVVVVFLVLQLLPALQGIRENMIYIIIIKLILSGIPFYFTWFYSRKPPLPGQILSSAMIFVLWLPFLISSAQMILLAEMVAILLLMGYIVYLFLVKKEKFAVLNGEAIYFALGLLLSMGDYTFVHNVTGIQFWEVPLGFGILAMIVTIVLLASNKIVLKDDRFSEKASLPILVLFCSFILMWVMLHHMNYVLDTKAPVEYMAVIAEKEVDTGHRSPTEYVFTLQLDDEMISLNVSQSAYYGHEIGETFPVLVYQGALGESFYIEGATQSD